MCCQRVRVAAGDPAVDRSTLIPIRADAPERIISTGCELSNLYGQRLSVAADVSAKAAAQLVVQARADNQVISSSEFQRLPEFEALAPWSILTIASGITRTWFAVQCQVNFSGGARACQGLALGE